MTIEEPQLMCAVVETEDGRVFMRFDISGLELSWVGTENDISILWSWKKIRQLNPVLRYEGFKERPKEPNKGWAAVVRDGYGRVWFQIEEYPGRWSTRGLNSWVFWDNIKDPEIIFEGVQL